MTAWDLLPGDDMRLACQIVAVLLLCAAAHAQVPETGRWQDLDFSESDVSQRYSFRYQDYLVNEAADGRLDDDPATLARVEDVATAILRAAIAMKPESAGWIWEIHTTSDPDVEAFCMAGGKLMIGSDFVRRLHLDDGELAVLIGHEVAHALADHHREMLSNVRRLSALPRTTVDVAMSQMEDDWLWQLRLATLSSLQEAEADQLGMTLAHDAGWPASSMTSFYGKLAAIEQASIMAGSHPDAASRLSMAIGMTRLFGK
jgi:predicted Zn-dependent protease